MRLAELTPTYALFSTLINSYVSFSSSIVSTGKQHLSLVPTTIHQIKGHFHVCRKERFSILKEP